MLLSIWRESGWHFRTSFNSRTDACKIILWNFFESSHLNQNSGSPCERFTFWSPEVPLLWDYSGVSLPPHHRCVLVTSSGVVGLPHVHTNECMNVYILHESESNSRPIGIMEKSGNSGRESGKEKKVCLIYHTHGSIILHLQVISYPPRTMTTLWAGCYPVSHTEVGWPKGQITHRAPVTGCSVRRQFRWG